jgi:hypothetical protein
MEYIKHICHLAYNMMEDANIIIEKTDNNGSLWLGNYKATLNLNFLLKNNISVIVNCTPDIPYIYEVYDAKYLKGLLHLETFRIPVQDRKDDINLMEQYYHIALPFILKKLLKEKKNIIINCFAGRQRSASIVALVLFVLIDTNSDTNRDTNNDKRELIIKLPITHTLDKSELMNNIINYIIKIRPQAFRFGMRVNFKESLDNFLLIK